jgi:hypothetical protein
VSALDNSGVYYASISDVIDLGKLACSNLRNTGSVPRALGMVQQAGYGAYESGIIVGAAANQMCPDVAPLVSSWARAKVTGA